MTRPLTVLPRTLAVGLLRTLLCLLWLGPLPAAAAPVPTPPPTVAGTTVEFPGIEQLVPLTAILKIEAQKANGALDKWSNLAAPTALAETNQQILLALDQNLLGWGPLDQWSEGRLLGARQRLTAMGDRSQNQLAQFTTLFKAHEELRSVWSERLAFWENWERLLKRTGGKGPGAPFTANRTIVHQVLDRTDQAIAELNELQQKLVSQQTVMAAWLAQIDGTLGNLRAARFERNAPPLFSTEFFGQFNHSLWVGLGEDFSNALKLPEDFHLRHGWIVIVQLVVTLVIAWQIYRRARGPEPVPEQLRFLFRHPLAGGLFLAMIGGASLYVSPPPLWQWLQRILGALSATVLICAMLERPRLRRVIVTLAALYVCTTTMRMVGLVLPAYRLFLVGVCLIAMPLCLAAARRQRQRQHGRLDLLAATFYLGALAGFVGLAAQMGGYANLTAFLVNAFLGTTFVFLFARMALHIGTGGIAALLDLDMIRNRRLMRRLGPHTASRLNVLMHVIVITYAVLYLLVHWDLYHTPGEAWAGIIGFTFKIGVLQVSLGLILAAACVLYLAVILSWIIQALLDAEVMTPHGMEHGVKVAVKTLIHYSLILVGFLVAISVAGIDMSKFAILAGALGVGIGFGLQNIVNNFLSGLILLFERPVKVGDTVSIDNQWGTITHIGLRSTVVETLDRAEVIVPNSELIAQKVTNWTYTSNVSRIVIPVGVAYGTPLEDVLAILLKVASDHAEVLDDPAPSAVFIGFGQSSIDFELRAWVGDVNHRLSARSELGLAIDRQFRAAGIVIPFPQRDLHLSDIAPNLRDILRPEGKGATKMTEDSAE